MSEQKIEKMPFETYLAVIRNSIGTTMFKEGYARIDSKPRDIMRGGELACAFYASSVLTIFSVLEGMHATVTATVRDLTDSGWKAVEDIQAGDVIVWQPVLFPDGKKHAHVGFALNTSEAVSNDYVTGTPQRHDIGETPDGTKREVDVIYRGKHLFDNQ